MSERAFRATAAAQRGDAGNGARAAKARQTAWVLAGLAVFVYVGYIAWMFVRASGG